MTSDALDGFSGFPWVIPDSETEMGDAKLSIPRLNYNSSRIPETDSRGPETEAGSLEAELRDGMHSTAW